MVLIGVLISGVVFSLEHHQVGESVTAFHGALVAETVAAFEELPGFGMPIQDGLQGL